jgi:hypothetical protein
MKALQVKKNGWLWKLAREGGLPADGMVTDKANVKYNRLLRAKHDANEITYTQRNEMMRDSERPIDFCDFTRYTLLGGLKYLILALMASMIFAFMVLPVLDFLLLWAIGGLFGMHWGELSQFQQLGQIESAVASGIGLVTAVLWHRKSICRFIAKPFRSKNPKPYYQRDMEKAQVAYDRAEFRKAFVQSMKGKTCFKMDVVE